MKKENHVSNFEKKILLNFEKIGHSGMKRIRKYIMDI